MEAVRDALAGSALEGVVVSKMEDVGVVSGADQGFYAWLAVNYLRGKFGEVSDLSTMQKFAIDPCDSQHSLPKPAFRICATNYHTSMRISIRTIKHRQTTIAEKSASLRLSTPVTEAYVVRELKTHPRQV